MHRRGAPATDVICPMYPSPAKFAGLTQLANQNARNLEYGRRWPAGSAREVRPVILCEYAHAMNNSTGNIDEYWKLVRSEKHLQARARPPDLRCRTCTCIHRYRHTGHMSI